MGLAREARKLGNIEMMGNCVAVARGMWRLALILRRQARYQEAKYQRFRRKGGTP